MATINIPGELHRVISLVSPGPCPACGEVGACRSTLPCRERMPVPGSFGAWLLQIGKERFDWVFEGVTLDGNNERQGPQQRIDMMSAAFAGGLASLLQAITAPATERMRDPMTETVLIREERTLGAAAARGAVSDARKRNRFEAWALAHVIFDHLDEEAFAAVRPLLDRWGALITPGMAAQLGGLFGAHPQPPGLRLHDLAAHGPVIDRAYQELVDRAQSEPRALEVLDELRAVSAAHECVTIRLVRKERQESRGRGSA